MASLCKFSVLFYKEAMNTGKYFIKIKAIFFIKNAIIRFFIKIFLANAIYGVFFKKKS